MPTSLFKITPTPPTSIQLEPGQEGELSFTIESPAAPDKVHEIILQALLIGEGGKGKEVDWLIAGPRRTLTMSGGKTETATITARPTATSPRGKHGVKLVIADHDRPNDVYADSPRVICEVSAAAGELKRPEAKLPWWVIPALAAALVLGLGGAVLGAWAVGCGAAEAPVCDDCPAGPPGPAGPRGPTGPQGPGLERCQWLFNGCNSAPGVECQQVCPRGSHPVTGGCDISGGGTLLEHRASVRPGAPFPRSGSSFTAFDRWVCEASAGRVQFTYALCCRP